MAYLEKKAIIGPIADYAMLGIPSAIGSRLGAKKGIELANEGKPLDSKSHAAEWLLPGAIGYRGAKEQTHGLQTFANKYNAMAKELHEQKAKEKTAIVAELARAGSRLIGHTPEAAAGVESAVRGGIGRLESGAKRVLNTPIPGTPEVIPGRLRGPLRKGVDFAIENPEVLLGTALPIPGGGALAHAGKRALERGINRISPPAPALMGKLAAEAEDELFFLKIAETNIGQWWENVGGPHLAKGGSHAEFKKMMENEGFSEPLRAKFTEIAEKKYPKGYNTGRSASSYRSGGGGPFKSTQPPDVVSGILKERAVGAGIIAAPLIAAGIYSAMSDSKEDPHTKVPEWKGRVGSYLASAGPMAAVGYSMGQLAGMGRASGNQPLVGAAMGALAGIGVGEMLHRSGEENALKSGLRAARTGKDKKLLREASLTQGKLTGLAAWQQMPLAVIGAMHGANPIVHSLAAAAGAFGGGMAEKRHRAAGVEHYDRLKGKQKAAAAEAEQSFTERNPNLTQWGKATATGAGLTGAALGAGALAKQQATKVRPGDTALNKHLYDTASVPIERTVGEVAGGAHFSPGATGVYSGLGGPVEPHVKVPEGWRNPAVLAHELGHADIHANRAGRIIQNPVTTMAGTVGAGSVGALGGFASGFSDNKNVRRAGLLAPLAMNIPTLAYEAGASIQGLRKLRQGGAGFGQLANAAKMLAPAYGSYALRAAKDTAGAAGAQAIGTAIHGSMKRRTAARAADGSKEAAGAPTRGGFMMASDVPSYRPPRLDRAIQKDGEFDTVPKGKEKDSDALPGGLALQPWDNFRQSKYSMPTEKLAQFVEGLLKEGIAGLKPLSQLESSSRVGAPRASAPPGPSIAAQSKPTGFGTGLAGAFKGGIGGTGAVGNLKPPPQISMG